MRHLSLVLGFILIVLVIIAGCSTTQKSIIEKKTDLNIGDSVVLTAKNGNSISITVVNISKATLTGSATGNFFNPSQTGAPTTVPTPPPKSERNYVIGYEIKNVGDKAITELPLNYWVTDWAGVTIKDSIGYHLCGAMYRCIDSDDPLYPGDSISRIGTFRFSDKSLEGKLTFYYQLGDDTASWIIKP
jgi:hypothetical protein